MIHNLKVSKYDYIKSQKMIFSSFVDNRKKYLIQSFIWVTALKKRACIESSQIHLCFSNDVDKKVTEYFANLGILISSGDTIDKRSKPLNKLNQLKFLQKKRYKKIILSDTDIVFEKSALNWLSKKYIIGANLFVGRPPYRVFNELMEIFNIRNDNCFRELSQSRQIEENFSLANNILGSIYSIDGEYFLNLSKDWEEISHMCLEKIDLIKPYERNIDQIAMTLAIEKQNILSTILSPTLNVTPKNKNLFIFDGDIESIDALHFHEDFSMETGFLQAQDTSHFLVKERIESINKDLSNNGIGDFMEIISKI